MTNKITIIAIGKIKEDYIKKGIEEYTKRLTPYTKLEIIELKDEGIVNEKKKIDKYLNNNAFVLDEKGKELSSKEFAKFIKKHEELSFIIGGANGIDESIKKQTISLSKMTFIHEMTRLILLEQIYRSYMIINNRPYHK